MLAIFPFTPPRSRYGELLLNALHRAVKGFSCWSSHSCLLSSQLSQQVQELFSKSGDVKRIIIGLDKVKKTACGFCFVEYPLLNVSFILTLTWRTCLLICSLSKSLSWIWTICCVRYYTRIDAENAMRFINGTRLDDRIIRTDWDAGFKEGRQYGRGKSGGQVSIWNLVCSERWQLVSAAFFHCSDLTCVQVCSCRNFLPCVQFWSAVMAEKEFAFCLSDHPKGSWQHSNLKAPTNVMVFCDLNSCKS